MVSILEWPDAVQLRAIAVANGRTFVGGSYESGTDVTLPGGLVLPPSQGNDGLVLRIDGTTVTAVSVIAGSGDEVVDALAADAGGGIAAVALSNGSADVSVGSRTVHGPSGKVVVARYDGATVDAMSAQVFASDDASFRTGRIAAASDGELIVGFNAFGGKAATSVAGIPLALRAFAGFVRLTEKGDVRWAKALTLDPDPLIVAPSVTIADDGTATLSAWLPSPVTTNDFDVVDGGGTNWKAGRLVLAHVDRDGKTLWSRVWPAATGGTNLVSASLATARDGSRVAFVGLVRGELDTDFITWSGFLGFAALLDGRTGVPVWYRSDPSVSFAAPRLDASGRLWVTAQFDGRTKSFDGAPVDTKNGMCAALLRFRDRDRVDALVGTGQSFYSDFVGADLDGSTFVAIGEWFNGTDWGDGILRITPSSSELKDVSLRWVPD